MSVYVIYTKTRKQIDERDHRAFGTFKSEASEEKD
jgi:hypothetical protein